MVNENVNEAKIMSWLDAEIESVQGKKNKRLLLNSTKIESIGEIEDKHIEYIVSRIPDLEVLSLGPCKKITDRCIDYLVRLNNLVYLDLSYCHQISHMGIKNLSALKNLKTLIIDVDTSSCNPTDPDKMLEILSKMANLTYLELSSNCYTKEDVDYLRHHLPACKIETIAR